MNLYGRTFVEKEGIYFDMQELNLRLTTLQVNHLMVQLIWGAVSNDVFMLYTSVVDFRSAPNLDSALILFPMWSCGAVSNDVVKYWISVL